VTLGSVAWPMLQKVGYSREAAGGLLSAGGLGAIISPPVLGAAAFLIAEFLKISYLDVILMATIPTCLYYLALFVMVEIDVRKFGMKDVTFERVETAWALTKKYWYHFLSLVSIVAFMALGFSPIMAVFWATVVSALTSVLRRDTSLIPYEIFQDKISPGRGLWESGLIKALAGGSLGVLNVAATCAGAGIIVGVVTLTGLGLKFSSIVLAYAGHSLLLTALYTSLIVWVVGLAVPVTASYIICAVIAAPALIQLGVPDFAAHMFIFYYAVLSEVSPPTALSPFAAAAITGGDPYKTTLQCWKYTVPAFLVPFMFVLDPSGQGLLLTGSFKTLGSANWGSIAEVTITAAIGIVALAGGFQGWLWKKTTWPERILLLVAGVLLVYPGWVFDLAGFALVAIVLIVQWLKKAPGWKPAIPTS
jgi:TRAP transporter 4TM/12TM fusion protein